VQSTADNYNDSVADSKLKLLGVWGDHHAADWEDLTVLRQQLVQRWFDLNMALGDYYTNLQAESNPDEQAKITRAMEHYLQAALVQPTYPEPVKALIQLYHAKNDRLGLNTIYTDYCTSCKEDEQEPEEEIIELYNQAIGTRKRRTGSQQVRQRKAV
jgi:hypothetical protein